MLEDWDKPVKQYTEVVLTPGVIEPAGNQAC